MARGRPPAQEASRSASTGLQSRMTTRPTRPRTASRKCVDAAEAVVATASTDAPPAPIRPQRPQEAWSGRPGPRTTHPRPGWRSSERQRRRRLGATKRRLRRSRPTNRRRPAVADPETTASTRRPTATGSCAGQEEDAARITGREEQAQASGGDGVPRPLTRAKPATPRAGAPGAEPDSVDDGALVPASEPGNGAAPEGDVKPMLRPPSPQRQRARRPAATAPPKDEQAHWIVPSRRLRRATKAGYVPMSEWIEDFDARTRVSASETACSLQSGGSRASDPRFPRQKA